MARSINEIKKTMTDAFMADTTIRSKYGLSATDTFSGKFSSVSIENILFYIVAACHYVLETIWDSFNTKVDEKIATAVVASLPWYYKISREYQEGDTMVWNEETQEYVYATIDESKQLIKHCAVRDLGSSIKILVAKGETPTVLTESELASFKNYMNKRKIAGIVLNIQTKEADTIEINATISVDGLTIDSTGKKIGGSSYPVEDAVKNYLANITYGGTFNKTKLVDAIQVVPGVTDVEVGDCYVTPNGQSRSLIDGNKYTAIGGCFISSGLNTSLSYVVEG